MPRRTETSKKNSTPPVSILTCQLCQSNTDGEVAGQHDFDTFSVNLRHWRSAIVGQHEALHDRFLKETPYGVLQVLTHAALRLATREEARYVLPQWVDELARASLGPHEVFATYCAIMAQPASQHESILHAHPDSYKDYFHTLASWLDYSVHTTYLKFLFAKTAAELVFAGPVIDRVISYANAVPIELHQIERPDVRLKLVIQHFGSRQLSNIIQECHSAVSNASVCPEAFNIQCENDWERFPAAVSFKADEIAEKIIKQRMWEEASRLMPCLPHSLWNHRFQQLASWLNRLAGINPPIIVHHLEAGSPTDDLAELRARRSARAVVKNPEAVVSNNLPALRDVKSFFELPGIKYLISESIAAASLPESPSLLVAVDTANGGTQVTAARVQSSAVDKLLLQRSILARTGSALQRLAVITAVPTAKHAANAYAVFRNSRTFGNVTVAEEPKDVMWYMGGDFAEWIELLSSCGSCQFMPVAEMSDTRPLTELNMIQLRDEVQQRYTDTSISKSRSIRVDTVGVVIRSEKLHGLWFRLLQAEAISLNHLYLQTHFNAVPIIERAGMVGSFMQASQLITSFWPEF